MRHNTSGVFACACSTDEDGTAIEKIVSGGAGQVRGVRRRLVGGFLCLLPLTLLLVLRRTFGLGRL